MVGLLLPVQARSLSAADLGDAAISTVHNYVAEGGAQAHNKAHALPMSWRMVYTLFCIDYEVRNGGFHQFFTNARGRFDSHLCEDLALFDHARYSKVIGAAFARYKRYNYGDQWENLGKSWAKFAEGYQDKRFEPEDSAYFAITEPLPEALGSFIRNNLPAFQSRWDADPFKLANRAANEVAQLSPFVRLSWHPALVACVFIMGWYRLFMYGYSGFRITYVAVSTLWFTLAIINWVTHQRLLAWAYRRDDDA